jgi:hypothetical protein
VGGVDTDSAVCHLPPGEYRRQFAKTTGLSRPHHHDRAVLAGERDCATLGTGPDPIDTIQHSILNQPDPRTTRPTATQLPHARQHTCLSSVLSRRKVD